MRDEHASEVVEHLQAAGLELIAAARAFLDVAEDLVKDPGEAVTLAAGLAARMSPPTTSRPEPPGEVDDADGRVQHIRVS